MALSAKNLVLLNDTAPISLDEDFGSYVGVEYSPFGADGVTASTGTIILEGAISGKQWVTVSLAPPTGAAVLLAAAAGIWVGDCRPYTRVRARMTVVGGAKGVRVYLNQQKVA